MALMCATALCAQKLPRTVKLPVHFLATSTSIRDSEGHNEDVYLVAISLPGDAGEIAVARLIDEFPPYRQAISKQLLDTDGTISMRLRRDRECDRPFGLVPLRTAPGDPSAVLAERLGFNPKLPHQVESADTIPCYRTVR
jgi:hypothetical protein